MLGGGGRIGSFNRALTGIEQNVVDSVVKLVLQGLTVIWKPIVDLTFGIRARETRPQMLRVSAPNEIVVMIVFDIKVSEARGTISLCIPSDIVEQVGSQFAPAWKRQRRELTEQARAWLMTGLVPVPGRGLAVLPLCNLPGKEIGSWYPTSTGQAERKPWT